MQTRTLHKDLGFVIHKRPSVFITTTKKQHAHDVAPLSNGIDIRTGGNKQCKNLWKPVPGNHHQKRPTAWWRSAPVVRADFQFQKQVLQKVKTRL